ncbi:uncharacterized protein LOC142254305 [Anomaloglossus baeobatrachus]|uniref:uncharacterized protein LOC142254305 n=1 Tax=Anomaloglossus baeobatrachus TaxID=238106 RepID=UPI003F4F96A3
MGTDVIHWGRFGADYTRRYGTEREMRIQELRVLNRNDSFNDVPRHKAEPTDPPDDQAGSHLGLIITLPTVGFLVLIIFFIMGYICYKSKANDNIKNSLLGITQNSGNSSLDSVHIEEKDPKEEELPPEHQPLVPAEPWRNEQQTHQMAAPCLVGAQREPVENQVTESPPGDVEYEESPQVGTLCEECRKPQPCDDQWVDFFYSVIENVQPDRMLQLIRKLHLHRTTIDQIVKDNPNDCKERSYKLLDQWRYQKGKQASMNAVFEVLNYMDLGGCCENIINDLRAKKIPMN